MLGPLAAALGVVLGGLVLHQARRTDAGLRTDRKLIQETQPPQTGKVDAPRKSYFQLITRKFTARERFATRQKRWGAAYLTGACLYALIVAGKAALGIVALAGVGAALATPVGIAVLAVMGIAGGITMAVGSYQFLALRGKSVRQSAYRQQESKFLSRKLDALHAVCCLKKPDGTAVRPLTAPVE